MEIRGASLQCNGFLLPPRPPPPSPAGRSCLAIGWIGVRSRHLDRGCPRDPPGLAWDSHLANNYRSSPPWRRSLGSPDPVVTCYSSHLPRLTLFESTSLVSRRGGGWDNCPKGGRGRGCDFRRPFGETLPSDPASWCRAPVLMTWLVSWSRMPSCRGAVGFLANCTLPRSAPLGEGGRRPRETGHADCWAKRKLIPAGVQHVPS